MRKSKRSIWFASVLFAAIIYFFYVEGLRFYLVPSESMEPTLRKSDYIGGLRVKPSELRRGDIVVFTSGYKGDFYVKRVIGLPGQTIAIVNGYVYIDGKMLDEPYVEHRGQENLFPILIPEGRVFIMGDNRTNSFDSRWFGPVPASLIKNRILFIYNPISRMGRVK
ncbi:MAG: signal peptidase I [Candidatus Lindowbacteria bacterium]|nr:signal peptidase I [Candidatus Lindowbacteria bacterium]